MPRFVVMSLLTVAVLLTGCAATEEGELSAGNRVICRDEQEIGSRLNKRVCKTAAEWETEREIQQDAMRNRNRTRPDLKDPPVASAP